MSADDLATRGKATAERVAAEKRNNHAVQDIPIPPVKLEEAPDWALREPPLDDEPPPPPDDRGRSKHRDEKATDDAPVWTFIDGATFILDQPDTVPALWGDGTEVLWAEDESLMIAGPMGLGKTTLAVLLMHAQLGVGDGTVLGLPVAERPGKILYLAMDRPAQIARAMRRRFTENERAVLAERLLIWRGPPPADIAKQPGLLLALAESAGAQTVYLDSVKDAAIGLSDDEVGAGYNRARQKLLADGVQLAEQHHTVKRGAGGGPPSTVADIYGSAWITNGTGSIIMLTGDPGDPIVGLRHVRAPADQTADEPPTGYPPSWRPKYVPVPDEELPAPEVEAYIGSLSPAELSLLLARAKGQR